MSAWPSYGIHTGVPFDIYRADDIKQADTRETVTWKSVSKSMLVDFMKDPGTWKRTERKESTAAMRTGSLVDCLLLEPEKFATRYAVSEFPDFRTKPAKEWRDEMEAAGAQCITLSDYDVADEMTKAVYSNPHAYKLLKDARTQVAFRHATRHGFAAKGLVDIVPTDTDTLVDLKTCEAGALESRRALQRHIYEWSYHIQAGAYLDGWNIAAGEERIRFKFIFVGKKPPYTVAVVELPMAAILLGAQQYQSAVNRFAHCIERNEWPSMWDGTSELDLPEYAYTETD